MPPAASRPETPGSPPAGGPQACVRRALEIARAALAEDPAAALSLPELAAATGVSARSLQRHFAAVLGRAPHAVVRRLRLAAARQTLRSGEASSVLDAALRHGFNHPGRFAIAYTRAFGEAPSASMRAARTPAPAAVTPSGTAILALPLQPATLAEAARTRRATDDLAIALSLARDLVLLSPHVPVAEAGRALRLEGRVEAGCVVLSLVQPLRNVVPRTLREALAPRAGRSWAERAVGALRAAIAELQIEQARRTPHHRADAETLVLRARPAMLTQDPASTRMAFDMLGEVLHSDPTHARAHALVGFGHAVAANHCFTHDPVGEREHGLAHARQALVLSGDDPEVLTLASGVLSFVGELEEAERLVTRALALDASQPEAWRRLGVIQIFRGDARSAAATFRRLLRGWPTGNDGNMALVQLGIASFALGDYARSARFLARALDQQPARAWPYRFLTAAATHAGAFEEARRSLAALRRAFPDLTIEQCARSDALHAEAKARVLDGLARAGLPW